MDIFLKSLLTIVIGFIIGYSTNYLAIKMLFYPRKKFLGVQGVLPKRKKELAKSISEVSPRIYPKTLKEIGKLPIIGPKVISSIKKSVEYQINALSEEEIEEIVLQVARKELNFISFLGGVIGALIGILQAALLFI